MCTCLKDTEKQLRTNLETRFEGQATIKELEPLNVGFPIIDGEMRYQPVLEFTYKSRKVGKSVFTNQRTTVLFNFCPFCGKPYKDVTAADRRDTNY